MINLTLPKRDLLTSTDVSELPQGFRDFCVSGHSRQGSLKLRVWPSRDFTIGQNRPLRGDSDEHPLGGISSDGLGVYFKARQVDANPEAMSEQHWIDLFNAYEQAGEFERGLKVIDAVARLSDPEPDRPMGLSNAINSRIHPVRVSASRKRRGTHGITSYAKKMVRSCGAILEERYGRSNLTFGTCTLPALEASEFPSICAEWSELTRRFFEELTRLLKRRGLDTDYVQVTEIQGKRFEKWGQVAPHLHFVCQGRVSRREFWRIRPDEIRHIWERLLGNVLGREVDGQAATRIERPRTSLAGELGKYISKGGTVLKAIQEQGKGNMLPSAWWGASRALRQEVKSKIREYTGEVAENLMDTLGALEASGDIWYYPIYLEVSREQLRISRDGSSGWESTRWNICIGASGFFKSRSSLKRCLPVAA